MFLGHDVEYDKQEGVIILRLQTYMRRALENMLAKGASEVTLR